MGYPTDKGPITHEVYKKQQDIIIRLRSQLEAERDFNRKQYQDNKTMRNILRYELEKELLRKMAAPVNPNPWELPNWASTFATPPAQAAPPATPPASTQDDFLAKLQTMVTN